MTAEPATASAAILFLVPEPRDPGLQVTDLIDNIFLGQVPIVGLLLSPRFLLYSAGHLLLDAFGSSPKGTMAEDQQQSHCDQ